MFGDKERDQRDFAFGLAGLTAGVHALRILAEKGIATSQDISVAQVGIKQVLEQVPEGQVPAESLDRLYRLIDELGVAAIRHGGRSD